LTETQITQYIHCFLEAEIDGLCGLRLQEPSLGSMVSAAQVHLCGTVFNLNCMISLWH